MVTRDEVEGAVRRFGDVRFTVIEHEDEIWGHVYEVIVHVDARQALELELKLAEVFPGVPIVVRWTGETNVSEDELVDYLVKVMEKSGLRPRALPSFDAVRLIKEERGD